MRNDDQTRGFDHGHRLTDDELDSLRGPSDADAAEERSARQHVLAHRRGVTELVRRLTDPDAGSRDSEVSRLVWGFDRAWALWSLAESGDRRLVPTLCRLVDDPDPRFRGAVLDLLGRHGDRRAVKPLLARLDDTRAVTALTRVAERHRSARSRAVDALIRRADLLRAAATDPERRRELEDGSGYVNLRNLLTPIVRALGRLPSPKAVPALLDTLSLEALDRHVREEAAAALGEIPDRRVVEPLLETLADPVDQVARSAAHALASLVLSAPRLLNPDQLRTVAQHLETDDPLAEESLSEIRRLLSD